MLQIAKGCAVVLSLAIALVVLTEATGAQQPPAFELEWGSAGTAIGQLNNAHGIDIDAAGNVVVTDTMNDRVQVFDADGVFLFGWGSTGTGPGQFTSCHGLGIGPTGDIYISEHGTNLRVQKFDSAGNFITTWGSMGTGDGQFLHPHGLAVDSDDQVFVVDNHRHRVQKFASDGTFLLGFGTQGTGNGQFLSPNGVTVDSDGNVYVADNSPRVQKFTNDGVFIMSWGSLGAGPGQFDFPRGLAVDSADNVYVVDRDNHRVQKFTKNGAFIVEWGSFGTGAGEFNAPYALRRGPTGLIYVADSSNNRIQKFSHVPTPGDFVTYGSGKPGSGGFTPLLVGSGDAVIEGTVQVDVTQGLGGSFCLLRIGVGQVPAGFLHVQTVLSEFVLVLSGDVPGAGWLSLPGVIPNNPSLIGAELTMQFLVSDPGSPTAPFSISASNGLAMTIGEN